MNYVFFKCENIKVIYWNFFINHIGLLLLGADLKIFGID